MTPLAATSPPTPTPASNARADRNASGSGDGNAFAQALERRQGARPGDAAARSRGPGDGASGPTDASLPGVTPDSSSLTGTVGASDADTLEAPTPAVVDIQQPAPVWPPAGLAALLGFPADVALEPADAAVTGDADTDARPLPRPPAGLAALLGFPADEALELADAAVTGDADTDARPLPLGGVLQPASMSLAPAALTLPDAVAPDAEPDIALPVPTLAVDATTPVEGGEPAPVAFTLPATAGLREPAPVLAAPLPTPHVGAEDFEARFGAQLEWMADQKIGHARIRVTPHDLGPVEVRLHMDGDRIRAEFVSAQAETRQALEQGLPRLRDLLGESGFQLAHAGVGSGQTGRDGAPSSAATQGGGEAPDGDGPAQAIAPARHRAVAGLLDAYA